MSEEEILLKNRMKDLADRCYNDNRYTFTNFLSLAEQSSFYEVEREVSFVKAKMWGGTDLAERAVLRFGSIDQLGYEEDFPIVCFVIEPLIGKFSDDLSHRDYLGALMNLGIEREVLGDIFIQEKGAVLFCLESMADYISENLTRVKHTSVKLTRLSGCPELDKVTGETKNIQIASERIDAVVSRAFNLSRSDSIQFFQEKRVFINGRVCENNSKQIKAGDRITLRGKGKFDYLGSKGTTKKGKVSADIIIY